MKPRETGFALVDQNLAEIRARITIAALGCIRRGVAAHAEVRSALAAVDRERPAVAAMREVDEA